MSPNFNEKQAFNPVSSMEAMFASKIIEDEKTREKIEASNGNDEAIKEILTAKFKRHPKIGEVSLDSVIAELKKADVIKPVVVIKEKKVPKTPEHIGVEIPKDMKSKVVEDEEIKKVVYSYQEREKKQEAKEEIFNENDVAELHDEILKLGKIRGLESDDYYNEFVKKGYYSASEVQKNINELREREEEIKKRDKSEKIKNKEIATMLEVALEYAVSTIKWYGKNVKIQPTCKFDDIKRRIDGILEILKKDKESNFMGLGIDATFQGLLSKNFKKKFFTLLKEVEDGYKPKVKYFKRHDGMLMKEFAVPKVILAFDFDDVKKMVFYLQNIKDPKIEEEFRNSSLKFKMMNQIINQCDILGRFAKNCGNDIYEEYNKVRSSIEELAKENPEIKTMLEVMHNDPTSRHLSSLIKEFEETEEMSPVSR